MKYAALMEDREIAVNFLIAIFKKTIKGITREEERELNKNILELLELGYEYKQIREALNTTDYRIVKAKHTKESENE
ncbi:MAG: hypothetical protein ACRCWG_02955 [Sarcina sp.]